MRRRPGHSSRRRKQYEVSLKQIRFRATEVVSFVVICRPRSGATLAEMKRNLTLANVVEYLPLEITRQRVIKALRDFGFTVYAEYWSPVVSASGPHRLFETIFNTRLVKVRRTLESRTRRSKAEYFTFAPDATPPATVDPDGHGTQIAANVFSCAPDATVIGIKTGPNVILALDRARAVSPNVISYSLVSDLDGHVALSIFELAIELVLLS